MDNHILALGFGAIFLASLWIVILLIAIYRILGAILGQVRGPDNRDGHRTSVTYIISRKLPIPA